MTLDLLSVLTGSAGTFVAFALGRANGYAKAKREKPAKQPKLVCGCGEHLAVHNPETGKCMEQHKLITSGMYRPCDCQKYTGPFPLDAPRPPFAELT